MTSISYAKIAQAEEYWNDQGFDRIVVPWVVPQRVTNVTKPPEAPNFATPWGDLVASGEQSFLYLMQRNELPQPKRVGWQCVTPCFRFEPVFDHYHLPYFLKVELIQFDTEERDDLHLARLAADFFSDYIDVCVVKTAQGYDVETRKNHIELGSYGIRRHGNFEWLYGTGLAEPRLSTAIYRND